MALESFDIVFLDDIYYFEIKGRIVDVHWMEGIFTYYGRIGEMEDKLRDKGFFRCHKSYLINYEKFCQEVLKVMRENGGI